MEPGAIALPSESSPDAEPKSERKSRTTTSTKGGRRSPYRRPPGRPPTHGAAMLTRVLRTASIDSVDGRSHLGVALRRIRDDLTAQLVEPSAAERILIEEAAKARVIAAAVGDYVLRQATLVDGESLLPIVDAHARLVDRLAKLLATLGLRPREKPVPSLPEYLAAKAAAKRG